MAEVIQRADAIHLRKNPNILEINTAVWLNGLSRNPGRYVRLGDVPASEWDRFKELGMDFIWLMGVWRRSRVGRKIFKDETYFSEIINHALPGWKDADVIGSPFSIVDYKPDAIIGGWEDLAAARLELNRRNIGLILDFVPNHTAREHDWVTSHPGFYIQGSKNDYEREQHAFLPIGKSEALRYLAFGRDPNFLPWTDTVQLNYFNPAVREAVIGEMKQAAGYCDGFRCDMAMLTLNSVFEDTWDWLLTRKGYHKPEGEFWSEATEAIPNFTWIAEAYWDTEEQLLNLGFNYVYDKGFYDRLKYSPPAAIKKHLETKAPFQNRLLRFLENHDESRSAVTFPSAKLKAAAVLLATVPGMKLYYEGQFGGKRVKPPVQLRRIIDQFYDPGLFAFYRRLLAITSDETFHQGEWELRNVYRAPQGNHSENLIAYTWRLKDHHLKLIVVNLGESLAQGIIPFAAVAEPNLFYDLTDQLTGKRYQRLGNDLMKDGLHVILDGYQSHIFNVEWSSNAWSST